MPLRESAGQGVTRRTLALSLLIVGVACVFPPRVGWTESPSNDFDQRLRTGQALLHQGKIDAAIAEFKSAVAAQPDSSIAHLWLGRALGRKIQKAGPLKALRMVGDVRREFERAVALDPNNVEARSDLLEFYLGAPRSFGGGIDKAKAQADAIAKLDPAMGQRAHALIEEKLEQERGGDVEDDD